MSEPKGAQGPTMEEILASIRKMIPDEEDGPAPRAGRPQAGAPARDELVLTQMLADDGSLVRLAASPASPQSQEPLLLTELVPSEPAAATPSSHVESETLEAFVRRSLEPQIQAWLEAHLPAMVERMVQDVIEGIRRKSERDKPSP